MSDTPLTDKAILTSRRPEDWHWFALRLESENTELKARIKELEHELNQPKK